MAKKFKISEEQYNGLMKEGVEIKADVAAANGDVKQAVNTAYSEAEKQGIKDYTVSVPSKRSMENSSKVITKKELVENRLKALKKNSEVFSVKDFFQKI